MKIHFSDIEIPISLIPGEISDLYRRIYKRLQHVRLPFDPWDNPFYSEDPKPLLIEYGANLGITVDKDQLDKQQYLNELHALFEHGYNGNTSWLKFHENIHRCETGHTPSSSLVLDYRELAGMLEQPFQRHWLDSATTSVKRGDVYVEWAELGKIPYEYWQDCEPNNIERIKTLAKPWLILRPKIHIAFQDKHFTADKNFRKFHHWWHQYHNDWCAHWKLPQWGLTEMYSVLVFGNVNAHDINTLEQCLKTNQNPERVSV